MFQCIMYHIVFTFKVYDFVSIFGSFCYHIAQILGYKKIPLGYEFQRLVATDNFVFHAAALHAADVQKALADAVGTLEEGEKITCPAPKGGVIIGFQAYHQVLFFQLAV